MVNLGIHGFLDPSRVLTTMYYYVLLCIDAAPRNNLRGRFVGLSFILPQDQVLGSNQNQKW